MVRLIVSTPTILGFLGDFETIEAAKVELFSRIPITEDDLTLLNNSNGNPSYSFMINGQLHYANFEQEFVNIVKWILDMM